MAETADNTTGASPESAAATAPNEVTKALTRRTNFVLFALLLIFAAALAVFFYRYWNAVGSDTRESALALLPSDANTAAFVDAAALRNSRFLAALYAWAPRAAADADYTAFVRATGFDYERDLDRVAVAIERRGAASAFFAVADGRFDRGKISAYAEQNGTRSTESGHEIFRVQAHDGSPPISFTFLAKGRMALTDGESLLPYLSQPPDAWEQSQWNARFERLAGSPIFAVIRTGSGASLPPAPGGYQSPQLAALLAQLQWITLAGKPDGQNLRLVAEGECASDTTARQLSDFLAGLVTLAEAGLDGPKLRRQLSPDVRETYLQVLQSADVFKIGRGETTSVRVAITITPALLEATGTRGGPPLRIR